MATRENSGPRFKCGDVVRLLSGGPAMTVIDVSVRGDAQVQWFDDADLCTGWVPSCGLMVAEPGWRAEGDDDD